MVHPMIMSMEITLWRLDMNDILISLWIFIGIAVLMIVILSLLIDLLSIFIRGNND